MEVDEVTSMIQDAQEQLLSCNDPAKGPLLKKIYDNLVADKRQLLQERSNLERSLTGVLCPCSNGVVLTLVNLIVNTTLDHRWRLVLCVRQRQEAICC